MFVHSRPSASMHTQQGDTEGLTSMSCLCSPAPGAHTQYFAPGRTSMPEQASCPPTTLFGVPREMASMTGSAGNMCLMGVYVVKGAIERWGP